MEDKIEDQIEDEIEDEIKYFPIDEDVAIPSNN
jgi:hypothetical protein